MKRLHFLFFVLLSASVWAQVSLVPVPTQRKATSGASSAARITAVKLPFFDDFSLARGGTPDLTLWQKGGGTVVNNNSTTQHPSVNVVTFDGWNSNGVPYSSFDQAQGAIDTLTSQPIDLSTFSPADSIYLSFYWQARGLNETPDFADGDSLTLQFLTNGGIWRTVWIQNAQVISNTFGQVLVPVRAQLYLHNNFQFRFQAYGRQSGRYDAWHVDYIYVNKGRRFNDFYVKDVATRKQLSPFLKRYWAMPLKQYLLNPSAETADSVKTDITNLFNNNNFTTFTFTVTDTLSKQQFQTFTTPVSENIASLASQLKWIKPTPLPTNFAGKKAVLKYKFNFLTTDDQNPSIPGINLRRNDTLSTMTVLDDFYAYDDGTAEYAARISRLDRAVIRFVLNKEDVVSAVRMNLARFGQDISGQSFVIQVLDSDKGKPNKILYQRAFTAQYPTTPDGFIEYAFDKAVAVKDTFYVGWFQLNEVPITVGLDKNNAQFANQIYFNFGVEWVQNRDIKGSLMLRPVIGSTIKEVVTATEPTSVLDLNVFPNPTTGIILWNDETITDLSVFDLAGRQVHQQKVQQTQADLSCLDSGLYLLRLSDGKREVVKKLIIRK
ncbi:MAG: T9SS type A sorting domain-containing protein [Spirosomataceae bacterium]